MPKYVVLDVNEGWEYYVGEAESPEEAAKRGIEAYGLDGSEAELMVVEVANTWYFKAMEGGPLRVELSEL